MAKSNPIREEELTNRRLAEHFHAVIEDAHLEERRRAYEVALRNRDLAQDRLNEAEAVYFGDLREACSDSGMACATCLSILPKEIAELGGGERYCIECNGCEECGAPCTRVTGTLCDDCLEEKSMDARAERSRGE